MPSPKGMLGVVVIAEIADVAGKQQYVARHLQGVGLSDTANCRQTPDAGRMRIVSSYWSCFYKQFIQLI